MSYLVAGVEIGQLQTTTRAPKLTVSEAMTLPAPDKNVADYQQSLVDLGFNLVADGLLAGVATATVRNTLRLRFSYPGLKSADQPLDKYDYEAVRKVQDLATQSATRPTTPVAVAQVQKPPMTLSAETIANAVKEVAVREGTAVINAGSAGIQATADKLPGWVLPVGGAALVWFLFLRK